MNYFDLYRSKITKTEPVNPFGGYLNTMPSYQEGFGIGPYRDYNSEIVYWSIANSLNPRIRAMVANVLSPFSGRVLGRNIEMRKNRVLDSLREPLAQQNAIINYLKSVNPRALGLEQRNMLWSYLSNVIQPRIAYGLSALNYLNNPIYGKYRAL
jgi:hypothetical protein